MEINLNFYWTTKSMEVETLFDVCLDNILRNQNKSKIWCSAHMLHMYCILITLKSYSWKAILSLC